MRLVSLSDTIAAISTPPGAGGIGIIRISGKDAFSMVQKLFHGKRAEPIEQKKSHTLSLGILIDPDTQDIIDEVLLSVMHAPNTYTKENIVEINSHGGQIVVQKILSLCLRQGARLAEPGEFTKRAFLNGRIDLTQAEAVMDIISAKTDLSRQTAVNQLGGNLRRKIQELREKILDMTASLEAAIDYPEHDIEEETYTMLQAKMIALLEEMQKLYDTADTGRILIQGLNTVILGKPNVGKSSLLNILLQEDRAIVTEIAGTTRDTLEEDMNLCGIPVKIIDTAGIRNTEDPIEKLGVEKSREYALRADLILMVADYARPFEKEDQEIISLLNGKKALILINKIDLPQKLELSVLEAYVPRENILEISVKNKKGIERVTEKIKSMFFQGDIAITEEAIVQNTRQKDALFRAICAIEQAKHTIEMQLPEDFISIDLQEALEALSELTGDAIDDEIIDRIFTKFCLGK